MSTFHTNSSGVRITPQQASLLSEYNIVQTEDDLIKRIDHIDYDTVNYPLHITHYLTSGETFSEIVDALTEESTSFEIITISSFTGYEVHASKSYMNGDYVALDKMVFVDELKLCSQEYDILTETAITQTTKKFFYDENDSLALTFNYTDTGDIQLIEGDNRFEPFYIDLAYVDEDTFLEYNPDFFTENPYYEDATFLP